MWPSYCCVLLFFMHLLILTPVELRSNGSIGMCILLYFILSTLYFQLFFSCRDRGVIISNDLSRSAHINDIVLKLIKEVAWFCVVLSLVMPGITFAHYLSIHVAVAYYLVSVYQAWYPVAKTIGVARILSGVHFVPKKLTTFLVVALKDRLNIPPNLSHQAKTVLKLTLALAGVHLHIFPVN